MGTCDTAEFVELGHKLADVAGKTIRQYFRKKFDVIDKADLSECLIDSFDTAYALVPQLLIRIWCRPRHNCRPSR